jgi:glucosamine-6-phosphate deaminase
MSNITILNSYDSMSEKVANIVANHIIKWPVTNIGFPTGSTPIGMYSKLSKMWDLEWTYVKTFNLDEYIINPNHKQSYKSFMKRHLFDKIDIMPDNYYFPDRNTEAYENKIRDFGGLDLCILGIGNNGHIAFNEPGSDFKSKTRVMDLTEETMVDNARFFNDLGEVPTQAITMGLGTIMDSKRIILMANGKNKFEILNKALNDEITTMVPASILQKHDNLEVYYCDETNN